MDQHLVKRVSQGGPKIVHLESMKTNIDEVVLKRFEHPDEVRR
jgi:hypothetical protein